MVDFEEDWLRKIKYNNRGVENMSPLPADRHLPLKQNYPNLLTSSIPFCKTFLGSKHSFFLPFTRFFIMLSFSCFRSNTPSLYLLFKSSKRAINAFIVSNCNTRHQNPPKFLSKLNLQTKTLKFDCQVFLNI